MAEKRLRIAPGIKVDFDAIAKGMIRMMEEAGDATSVNVIRFGMLPKVWVDMAEKQFKELFDEKFASYRKATEYASSLIGVPYDPEDIIYPDVPGGPCREFKFKDLMHEVMHELALALYGSVKMVV